MGYSPWGCKELGKTEMTCSYTHSQHPKTGDNPNMHQINRQHVVHPSAGPALSHGKDWRHLPPAPRGLNT